MVEARSLLADNAVGRNSEKYDGDVDGRIIGIVIVNCCNVTIVYRLLFLGIVYT